MSDYLHYPINDQDPGTLYIKKNSTTYTTKLGQTVDNKTQADVDTAVVAGLVGQHNFGGGVVGYLCQDMDERFPLDVNKSPVGNSVWGTNGQGA